MRSRCHPALLPFVLLGTITGVLTMPAQQTGPSVFKANARIVVLDVVVSGKNLRPLTGLHQQDFALSEDGRPQTISYFEAHSAAQPASPDPASLPAPGPNTFTNTPRVPPADYVAVLVLDSLNTPLADQSNLRVQVLKYIKKLPQGRRMAIFTLGSQLHFVQGFTDDPSLLAAAVNSRKKGASVQSSPLLQTGAERAADQEVVAALRATHAEDAAEAMQQFMADQGSDRSSARIQRTLAALQELARYLAGFPGRKNVVWFSGAFPVVIFPNPALRDAFGAQADNQGLLRRTDALLAAAQMAIYPVSAEGVATDAFNAAADARLTTRSQLTRPDQNGPAQRGADHSAMDQIAKDTGGVAFYGTNSLGDALERVAAHGSNFYTLTYTSTNPNADGQFRKIEVKLANAPGYQLAYRRGYYADDAKSSKATAGRLSSDLLSPYLRPGLPDSTQVPITLRLTRSASSHSTLAGDNPNLQGPLTRCAVDFLIPAHSLQYELTSDGHRLVHVESGLVVYNSKGEALNWILRQVNLNLDAARYALAQSNGVNLYLEIDAPATAAAIHGGVYDLNAQLAGTTQIPLAALSKVEMSLKPK